jgi:hypothetical protein
MILFFYQNFLLYLSNNLISLNFKILYLAFLFDKSFMNIIKIN